MSIQGDQDTSLVDVSRDDNDSDPDGKSRTRHLRLHEKLFSPSRIRYYSFLILINKNMFFSSLDL